MIKTDGKWHHTNEEKRKITFSHLGSKNPFFGKHHSKETRDQLRQALGGKNHPNYGKHLRREVRMKISQTIKKRQLGENNPFYGRRHTEESKRKISQSRGDMSGKANPNWIDGRSFEPYTSEFNRQLKELIRHRDGYQCQKCGHLEMKNEEKLSIHHIDYNKKNCLPSNLISLCQRCNTGVNSNRKEWENYFNEKIPNNLC